MYRLKTLTGQSLVRRIGSQTTEVAIRVGVLNHIRFMQQRLNNVS